MTETKSAVKEMVDKCKADIAALKDKINMHLGETVEEPLADAAAQLSRQPMAVTLSAIKYRRVLKGHFGKVYAMHWSNDNKHLVSASQDGKLIIWNGFSTFKEHAIPLKSPWVACGGLDNLCTVFKLPASGTKPQGEAVKAYAELANHEGYLSCCRFINDDEIITASGDSTCILWDVEQRAVKNVFSDHLGDVMSVAVWDPSGRFVSGSVDNTAKLWDHRCSSRL